MSVFGEIENSNVELSEMTRVYGVELAKVTSTTDPEKKNRVKCRIVSADKTAGETNWAMITTFMSGTGKGAAFYPSVGDMVLLAYINGDVHRPVVIGSLWTKEGKMPYSYGSGGENDVRSVKTASGAEVLIDDTAGKEKISVTTKAKTTLTLDDGGKTIKLQDQNGSNGIVINTGSGEMTIKVSKKITLQAGSAKIIIDGGGGKITVESMSEMTLKSAQINLKANTKLVANGSGQAELSSNGITRVKGSMLKLN